jgi:hypothetical protein
MPFDWYHQRAAEVLGLLSGWASREIVLVVLSHHVLWFVMLATAASIHLSLIVMVLFPQSWLVATAPK